MIKHRKIREGQNAPLLSISYVYVGVISYPSCGVQSIVETQQDRH
jgi:hypothetical protein